MFSAVSGPLLLSSEYPIPGPRRGPQHRHSLGKAPGIWDREADSRTSHPSRSHGLRTPGSMQRTRREMTLPSWLLFRPSITRACSGELLALAVFAPRFRASLEVHARPPARTATTKTYRVPEPLTLGEPRTTAAKNAVNDDHTRKRRCIGHTLSIVTNHPGRWSQRSSVRKGTGTGTGMTATASSGKMPTRSFALSRGRAGWTAQAVQGESNRVGNRSSQMPRG